WPHAPAAPPLRSEVQPQRQLDDARRARRVRDADRRPEVRVDLVAGGIEPRRPIDVLELDLVEEVVGLDAELRGQVVAEAHVLEDREVRVDDARLLDRIAWRRRAVLTARRPRERRGVEETGERIAAAGERIADEHRPHEVQARLAAGETGAV